MALALGSNDENAVNMRVKGPSDGLQALLVFQSGGGAGWHTHSGPVVVVVKSGALTEVYATFLSTAGANPLMPASDPGGVCHESK